VPVAFRAVSAMASGTTSVVVTTPASAQNGDVLVAFIGDRATSGNTNPPTGWSRNQTGLGAGGRIQIFTAIVGVAGVTANQTTTWSTPALTIACIGAIAAYSGVDNNTPIDTSLTCRSNASGTTGTAAISTVTWGAYIVLGFISFSNGSTWSVEACATNPTSGNVTERLDSANGTTNSIAIADGQRNPATAGGTGASSATMGTAGANGGGIIALRPASTIGSTNETVTPGFTSSVIGSYGISSIDGVTTGAAFSGLLVRSLSTTDGVTTGAAFSGLLVRSLSTTDGVTTGAAFSGLLVRILSTTDGVTTGAAFSGLLVRSLSTTDGVTTGTAFSGLLVRSLSTADGVTSGDIEGGLGAPFRVTGGDGVTSGFASSGIIVHGGIVGSTSDGVTVGMLSSAQLLGVANSSSGVTVGIAVGSTLISNRSTTDGVAVSVATGGALISNRSTTDGVAVTLQSNSTMLLVAGTTAVVVLSYAAGVRGMFSVAGVDLITLNDSASSKIVGEVPEVWTGIPISLLLVTVQPASTDVRYSVAVANLPIVVPSVQLGTPINTGSPVKVGTAYDSIQF